MIKVENLEVFNFKGAIRGLRNPLESWEKSDRTFNDAKMAEIRDRKSM